VDLADLKQAVFAADPAAVLVSPRILRRVLQAEFRVPYLLAQAPHEQCYFFDRQVLFRYVEQDELDLEPDRLLPPTVILLTRPTAEQLQDRDREALLLEYWRLLFHARIHLELHRRHLEGQLTPADIRSRVERIGETAFQEIRTVLQQENYLLPPGDDLGVYCEFVSVYLELRYFRTNLLATYFPAIRDFGVIDQLLAADVDGDTLFAQTRLPGAPAPVILTDTSSDESHDYYWRLLRHADRAIKEGDLVRAAILHTKATRVAPAAWMPRTRSLAMEDLRQLTLQFQDALHFRTEEVEEWMKVLPSLLDKADQGTWPVEAKLLLDLQNVCVENRRKLYALDLIEWVLSAGKRPIRRPLTSLQIVRSTKYLRNAAQRLTMARVSDEDRQRLAKLLQSALHHSEERVRERFWPVLHDAFYDVGLVAASPPEQVALEKMIEELLDRIMENGFFTFSDLRDTISRNQLKLPDLSDPHSYWTGDPLRRLDRRLSTVLEGVYRHGEFYLRWMESVSSLFFGTSAGRLLTLHLIVPFGGAFALLLALDLLLKHHGIIPEDVSFRAWLSLPVGVVFWLLIHVGRLRDFLLGAGHQTYRGLRFIFYDLPTRLSRLPVVEQVLKSWPFLLFYWHVVKPLPVTAAVWLWGPAPFRELPLLIGTFIVADLLLNSRFARAFSEALTEALVVLYGWLRFDVLQGLFRLVNQFFKQITRSVEQVLYTVDEWLRFRSDESRLTMIARAILGVLWFPVGYLIRLYFITLIEPTLNPLKLPISIMAAKFFIFIPNYLELMKPRSEAQLYLINQVLSPRIGEFLAVALTVIVIVPTLYMLPSAFAFFVWEMQANWRLFRANRSPRLRPVVVGRHGETVLQLLKPGVHSGTIPRLFAQLRADERSAYLTGDWRPARAHRQALQEVARSVKQFVERDCLALIQQSRSWPHQPIFVGQILLSCNRIRIELCHAGYPQEPVGLALEERSGWLIGSITEPGWLRHLPPEGQRVMNSALAGLYKIAGVDLVREQLRSALTPQVGGYQLNDGQLVVWTKDRDHPDCAYTLRDQRDKLRPRSLNAREPCHGPILDARAIFFSRTPLGWEQWVECWQKDHEGHGHPYLLGNGATLLSTDGAATNGSVAPRGGS
jgi:hypothetical protein